MFKTCIYIFFARLLDVSLGTVKTYYSVKGKALISTIISFFEVYIWFLVAKDALNNTHFLVPIFYSLGYATGNLIGTFVIKKYLRGNVSLNIVSTSNKLSHILRKKGYAVTLINLEKTYDNKNKYMLFLEIDKKYLKQVLEIIEKEDRESFIVVNDTKSIVNGFIK